MSGNTGGFIRTTTKLGALGVASFAVATAFMSLGTATASADVTEVAPRPNVTSRQAQVIDQNALRRTAAGNARGQESASRADNGGIRADGEVRDGVKAVPGTTASPFNLNRQGMFVTGPPIGSW